MQFTPSHPYLAEYDRSIVVVWANGGGSSAKLFPDTGGYARSQLYQRRDGSLFVKGFFDVAHVDPSKVSIMVNSLPVPQDASYIGAFDYVQDFGFRFLRPEESDEQPLVVGGS